MEQLAQKGKIIDIKQQVEAVVEQEREIYGSGPEKESVGLSSQGILDALNANEDGDAWIFTNLQRDKFCYDHGIGTWFRWTGNYWEEDVIKDALAEVDSVVEIYAKEASKQSIARINATKKQDEPAAGKAERLEKGLLVRIHHLQSVHRKRDVLILAAAGSDSLGITGDQWDLNPWLLGCKNGVVDLKSGEFRPGRPEDYIKTVAPTQWLDIETPAPTWERFLGEIYDGDKDLIAFVQRLLGYSITGLSTEHILPILWGKGRNGKGTLLETISDVLGPLAGAIQSEMLLSQARVRSSAGPSPDIMALRGRRIVWGSEVDEGRRLDIGKMKWLVGGDTLVGRHVHGKREIQFKPTHTLFLLTNHKPHIPAEEYAAWERIHLVPFTLSFVDDPKGKNERKRDPYVKEKLIAESPGILAWLIRGCIAWQEEGLSPPDTVKEATEKYREDEDVIGQFVEEGCALSPTGKIQAKVFHDTYRKWCESNGHSPLNGKKFGERMRERFERVEESGRRFYKGVNLITF